MLGGLWVRVKCITRDKHLVRRVKCLFLMLFGCLVRKYIHNVQWICKLCNREDRPINLLRHTEHKTTSTLNDSPLYWECHDRRFWKQSLFFLLQMFTFSELHKTIARATPVDSSAGAVNHTNRSSRGSSRDFKKCECMQNTRVTLLSESLQGHKKH